MSDAAQDLNAMIDSQLDAEPDAPVSAPEPVVAAPAQTPPVEAAPVVPDTTATSPEPPSAPPVSSEPVQTQTQNKDYEDWITRFGGPTRDPNVAAKAAWEMNNRLAQQARPEAPAPPVAPVAPSAPVVPQELQRFDGDLRRMETRYSQISTKETEYRTQHDRLTGDIDRTTRLIVSGRLDLDKEQEARTKLADLVEQRDTYGAWLERFEGEKATLDQSWRVMQAQRDLAEQLVEFRTREAENKRTTDEAELSNFGRTFQTVLPTIAKEGTGDQVISDKDLPRFDAFVRQKVLVELTGPDRPLKSIDLAAFTRAAKAEYLAWEDAAHSARSAKFATRKVLDTTVSAPEGKHAVAPVVKQGQFKSAKEVEAAIDAGLGL